MGREVGEDAGSVASQQPREEGLSGRVERSANAAQRMSKGKTKKESFRVTMWKTASVDWRRQLDWRGSRANGR